MQMGEHQKTTLFLMTQKILPKKILGLGKVAIKELYVKYPSLRIRTLII